MFGLFGHLKFIIKEISNKKSIKLIKNEDVIEDSKMYCIYVFACARYIMVYDNIHPESSQLCLIYFTCYNDTMYM